MICLEHFGYYEYLSFNNERFFTAVLLPKKDGQFPCVIIRSPYVSSTVNTDECELTNKYLQDYTSWLDRGYAIVIQHCKGQGKSTGAFVPYVHEHEDGIALREWIRKQSFYNKTLLLMGASYTASLHYCTAPYEEDIKAAVFEVQDTNRYRLWYRNGQMRKGHANWHFSLYKPKCNLNKTFSMQSFSQLPLKDLSTRVLGEEAVDFEQMLEAYNSSHKFWATRNGGSEAKDVTDNIPFPALFTTGYNDYYIGGMFDMWRRLNDNAKQNCAFLVSPYNHGDGYNEKTGLRFEKGKRSEQFGNKYQLDWFDHVLYSKPIPFKKGVVTYYRTFENTWQSDFYGTKTTDLQLPLGDNAATFEYDPKNPPAFCEEGNFVSNLDGRKDVVTVYTKPFDKDVFIKGAIKAQLAVSSDCDDTSFYINISIKKPQGDYRLRHDITALCYQLGSYEKNKKAVLNFSFDEYAFLLKKGEVLRIDITSTDNNTYVCHTNNKGEYYLQTDTKMANNTVYLDESYLVLPIE